MFADGIILPKREFRSSHDTVYLTTNIAWLTEELRSLHSAQGGVKFGTFKGQRYLQWQQWAHQNDRHAEAPCIALPWQHIQGLSKLACHHRSNRTGEECWGVCRMKGGEREREREREKLA